MTTGGDFQIRIQDQPSNPNHFSTADFIDYLSAFRHDLNTSDTSVIKVFARTIATKFRNQMASLVQNDRQAKRSGSPINAEQGYFKFVERYQGVPRLVRLNNIQDNRGIQLSIGYRKEEGTFRGRRFSGDGQAQLSSLELGAAPPSGSPRTTQMSLSSAVKSSSGITPQDVAEMGEFRRNLLMWARAKAMQGSPEILANFDKIVYSIAGAKGQTGKGVQKARNSAGLSPLQTMLGQNYDGRVGLLQIIIDQVLREMGAMLEGVIAKSPSQARSLARRSVLRPKAKGLGLRVEQGGTVVMHNGVADRVIENSRGYTYMVQHRDAKGRFGAKIASVFIPKE